MSDKAMNTTKGGAGKGKANGDQSKIGSGSINLPKRKHVSTMMGEFVVDSIADSFNKAKNKSKINPAQQGSS